MVATEADSEGTEGTMSASTPPRKGPLPVTVLSGFLGSGKTSLLKHILANAGGLRIAALVNDVGSIVSDDSTAAALDKAHEVVQLKNGCICCNLADSLLDSLLRLAQNSAVDYCVVESTGVSEPMPVAEVFALTTGGAEDADGNHIGDIPLSKFARLDTMVTLLDAKNFSSDLASHSTARMRWGKDAGDGEEADREVAEILADQLEFANVVIVNKCDLIPKEEAKRVCAAVRAFNANATVMSAEHSKVSVASVINTGAFSFTEAAQGKRWLAELRAEEGETEDNVREHHERKSEVEQFDISSAVYRRRRPFHPKRFAVAAVKFARMRNALLRSKGFVWLATKREGYGEWSQAGAAWSLKPGGRWLCETPRSEWPSQDPEFVSKVLKDMHEDSAIGDRRQELVFIGQGLRKDEVFSMLDDCLLTTEEMADGAEAWMKLVDPFGEWDFTLESGNESDDDNVDALVDHKDPSVACPGDGGPRVESNEQSRDITQGQQRGETAAMSNLSEKRGVSHEDGQDDTAAKKAKLQ